jgi:tetratricopeptide (TPR) repeat protein
LHAEQAYLFRHALLRDAAYQLQLPGDRARLHALAFAAVEALAGGPAPLPDFSGIEPVLEPCECDSFAEELAGHAKAAIAFSEQPQPALILAHAGYLLRAARRAERAYQYDAAFRLWHEQAQLASGAQRARLLRMAGQVALQSGKARVALPLFESALALSREASDKLLEAAVLGNLGSLHRDQGRMAQSEECFKQALAILPAGAHSRLAALMHSNLSNLYVDKGRIAQSQRELDLAESAMGAAADSAWRIEALSRRVTLDIASDQWERARDHLLEMIEACRQINDRRQEGVALANLGSVYMLAHKPDLAQQSLEQALQIHREIGNRRSEGMALGNLGIHFQGAGKLEEAEGCFAQALAINREVGNRRSEGIVLGNLGALLTLQERYSEAESSYMQSLVIHRQVDNPRHEGLVLGYLAGLLRTTGRATEALGLFDQAIRQDEKSGAHGSMGMHLCERALLVRAMEPGNWARARADWCKGAEILERTGQSGFLKQQVDMMHAECAKAGVPAFDDAAIP